MKIVVDTSAIVATLNKADRNHSEAVRLLDRARRDKAALVITNFIVGETYATLLSRVGSHAARRWLAENDIPVLRVTLGDERRAREILLKYTDKDFSYVDATTFALMERLNIQVCFAFDVHFEQFGFRRWA